MVKSGGIRLSKAHGLNPSMVKCFFCGNIKEIALFGHLPDDEEAPREVFIDTVPCDKCASYMEKGVIIIETRDADKDYRLDGFVVVSEESAKRIFNASVIEKILEKRVVYMGTTTFKHLFG